MSEECSERSGSTAGRYRIPLEERTPADQILADCAREIHTMENAAPDVRCPDLHHRSLTMLIARMLMPIYRSYNNGGLPSKRASRSRFKIGKLEFEGRDAMTLLYRIGLILLLAVVYIRERGGQMSYDSEHGVVVRTSPETGGK